MSPNLTLVAAWTAACFATPVSASTIGFWNLDDAETPGTIADLTANHPPGTPVGEPGYSRPGVPAGSYGPITVTSSSGTAIGLSVPETPAPNYFVIGADDRTAVQEIDPGGAFSVMSWVKLAGGVTGYRTILSTGGPTGVGGWKLAVSAVGLRFTTYGVADNNSPAVTIGPEEWHHVAVTYDNGTITYYLDGISIGSGSSQFLGAPAAARLTIGHRIDARTAGDQFGGSLDGVRVDSVALDEEGIRQAAVDSLATEAADDPLLVVSPTFSLDNNGAPESFEIPFTNQGREQTLTLASVTLNGPDAAFFTIDGFTAAAAPGEQGSIEVTFHPAGNGSYLANLLIASNDAFSAVKSVTLSASVSDPVIEVSASRVDFGELAANPGPQTRTVTMTNTGGAAALEVSGVSFPGQGGNGFSIVSFPASLAPGESAEVVIGFDPGSGAGEFGDLLRIETNAANAPARTLPVRANVAASAGEKPLTVVNGDFEAGVWNSMNGTSPQGWFVSLAGTNGTGFYGQDGSLTPRLTSIGAHFQSFAGYYEQNLSANHPGLTAGEVDAVTVSFDRVYRNDAATNGPAMLRVSLWDATNDLEIAGRDLLFEDPGVQAGNQLAPVVLRLGYDASAYGTEELSLRIARIPPLLASGFYQATLVIDNVRAAVDGDWEPADDAYAAWADAAGLDGSPGRERGPADDPDGDGISNFDEFSFGGDPLSARSGMLSAGSTADTTGDSRPEWILTVAVRADATFTGSPSPAATAHGVHYTIEGSLDLESFTSPVEGPLSAPVVPAAWPATPPAGYRYVSFRLASSNGLSGKGFLRATATAAP